MAKFIYENIVMIFCFPQTLISNKDTYFINATIQKMLKKFMIENLKTTTYHPQENDVMESFNKMLHKGLTKICNLDKDD